MPPKRAATIAVICAVMPAPAPAQEHRHGPYAGLEQRQIKSLSEQDIAELRRGGGWGLALPAELNGLPGPAHLLELRDALDLSTEQVQRITALHDDMRKSAIVAGERFIAAEAALSAAFTGDAPDDEQLRALIDEAATARAELRFIHLSRHLITPDILSPDQISRYNQLRGYTDAPCAEVPQGHDPDMWRRQNGCD
ncbi:Spy/CpxP family protein refolding chaperone [Actibacterium ureilyticum]|uniref:Spy/CpxP family protein refolding chaperone n=1 Tax=Actibacterium ureilyticum TaxID=1590614 RepID=UPI001140F841|nr:periplasmic heavy metal sensor [Actibacterium ureilyticum]